MAIRTVATIIGDEAQIDTQLVTAADVARALDAHLSVLILSTGFEQIGLAHAALDGVSETVGRDESVTLIRDMGAKAAAFLKTADVRWNMEAVATTRANQKAEIVKHTRFSDLVFLQRGAEDARDHMRELAEQILFDGGTPLLILPDDAGFREAPRRIMVAWDESATALRATRQALPLLSDGAFVHVVMADPPREGPERSSPGGDFAAFLSRQGVDCEITVTNTAQGSVSSALESHARELGCDLLVMGAYGHSRLRQAIFGGTTRDLLDDSGAPVFMAH